MTVTDPTPPPDPDPPTWKTWISAGIAIIALLGFIYVFFLAFKTKVAAPPPKQQTVAGAPATPQPRPDDSTPLSQVATILAGLVTSVVAAALGVSTGQPSTRRATRFPRLHAALARVGAAVSNWSTEEIRRYLAIAYAVTYIVVGAIAVVRWLSRPSEVTEEVKNLAWTFIGFIVATVKSFF